MTENVLISDQIVKIPFYFLPRGTIVLDGDIYKLFNYSSVLKFRNKLKELENDNKDNYFFRLTSIDKYCLKVQNPNISFLNTSAQAFAFKDKFIANFLTICTS
jgi:hypothetical protein